MLLGLPKVELGYLTRAVDGALIGAFRADHRAQLAQGVVKDGLTSVVAELTYQLPDAGVGNTGMRAQKASRFFFKGIEL